MARLQAASEEDLACRVQEGCADSFTELVKRLQPRLLFVLSRRVPHHADAEDIAQQTLLRAFQKIQLYDTTRKFSPWIFTIALRLATDHYRRRKLPTEPTGERAAAVVDIQPGPELRAIHNEAASDLWEVAELTLPPEQWTALWLLYGEGQTVREVARALGRTAVSVRVLLYRARKKLAPHLAKYTTDEDLQAEVSAVVAKDPAAFATPSVPQTVRAES
jgi:RNA polymerase sigma-70 factor (ECF subfamily)